MLWVGHCTVHVIRVDIWQPKVDRNGVFSNITNSFIIITKSFINITNSFTNITNYIRNIIY